ncbi:hypothetical protein RCL_jg25672.t1 [Rhizophagus clarus]|uniref:Uncharacterized protein n=1 Tax=Rhizophagus clarus TaxID=94130 RepID=A0A8H3KZA0_9GLOM|nr:hypothetical protein RCL_jg25672.t1 [Rhizophagus clarus]
MKFKVNHIILLIIIYVNIALTINLKSGLIKNEDIPSQHKNNLTILHDQKKRKSNPVPLDFVPSKSNPLRKRSREPSIEYEKYSRYKRFIRKRKLI